MADVELQGTTCRDWEDIAVNVEAGRSFIYLADTGDNFYQRSSLTIYKFPEPEVQTCKHCLTMCRVQYKVYPYWNWEYPSVILSIVKHGLHVCRGVARLERAGRERERGGH